jgi:putative lipoic acid-binding regulatory protein
MEDTPLTFPCVYPLKVMGANTAEFRAQMRSVISAELGAGQPLEVAEKLSANAKFVSLTCTVDVPSRDELDRLYRTLHATGHVLMAL